MRRRSIPLGLALLALALGLAQRPGTVVADTKVDLYVDPARFLSHVLSVWSPTTDLGHVFGAQYSGYAFPMAPFFALGRAVGLPVWLVHRLWLAAVLALAAWGVVRLLDALHGPRRGVLHAAAGALYIVNPYVTVDANRTSIALLSYAALPWLLLAVHRGLRAPRGWWWPAAFALVLTSTGGGVNAGTTGWLLLGPALLLVYEVAWGGVPGRAVRPWLVRMVAVNAVAQAWWVIPVLIQAKAAPSFLPFSEQPGTIWSTTSLPESLRLMGFWTSYVGVGYGGVLRPFSSQGNAMLYLAPVVVAGLLVPALSLTAFGWTRRWRYAPFFLLLVLVGLMVMAAGFPGGTLLRRGVTFAYYEVQSIQFLRTTYKAGPLTALGLACLGGAGLAALWARVGTVRLGRVAAVAGAAGLAALAAWPLVSGRAPEGQLAFSVPDYWRAVGRDLDRRGDDSRALVEPGQLFAYYRWGGTIDPILPALTRHPVTTRWIVPFSDRRASELQWTVDDLIGQERLRPGQLAPLLDLMGVGDLVVPADGDRSRSGEAPAGDAARELGPLPGAVGYGPPLRAAPDAGTIAPPVTVPAVRRVPVRTGGLVRLLPRAPLTVVDGGAGALAGLASYGALDPGRPIAYAPDIGTPAELRADARAGASFVVADRNGRRAIAASHPRGSRGPVLTAGAGVGVDGALLDPFAGAPPAETVAVLRGARSVRADASPQVTQFPERRPEAALDGDTATAWLADRTLERPRHALTVTFTAPRAVPFVDLMPYSDSRAVVRTVEVGGRRFAVHRGWNRLPVRLARTRALTVRLARVTGARRASDGAGGIRELRIPGVRVTEALRPPTVIESALRGADLRASALTYVFERDTADVPARRGRYAGERGASEPRDAQDPEQELRRVFAPPAPRRYAVDGWASVDPVAPDAALDAIAGTRGALRVDSSSRFENRPRYRGSGAFDGSPARAWIGQWIAGRPAWLQWRAARPVTVRRLVLEPPAVRVRHPTRVRLTVDGRRGPPVAVGPDGAVALSAPARGRTFRLDVLAARFPPGTPAAVKQRRAVGIGEVRGAGVAPLRVARGGTITLPCGAAAVAADGRRVPLGGPVSRDAFDAGRPLRVAGCDAGATVALGAGGASLNGLAGPLRADGVRLRSPAPAPVAPPPWNGRVLDSGRQRDSGRDGVRITATGPSWLVLGQSYDRGWRATCDGRDLGAPRPMQGYANAWPVAAGCRAVSFRYSPQRVALAGYVVSAIGCLALLVLLLVGRRRVVDAPAIAPPSLPAAPEHPRRLAPGRAAGAALVLAAVLGFCFGLRAGVVLGPLIGLALWRGVPDRVLVLLAGALLAVGVPASYLLVAALSERGNRGGYDTEYAADRVAAHWIALAALTALGLVLWRTLAAARAGRAPAGDDAPAAAPEPLVTSSVYAPRP
jgi:arabinofuranan 3-O-arabinosyltransferase